MRICPSIKLSFFSGIEIIPQFLLKFPKQDIVLFNRKKLKKDEAIKK